MICCANLPVLRVIAVSKLQQNPIVKKYFYQLWRQLVEEGVIDPDTGIRYVAEVRINHAR